MIEACEIWKDVPGYEGLYKVSNKGNVKTLPRIVKSKNRLSGINTRTIKERNIILNPSNGYFRVTLCDNNNNKRFLVHRLVALAFIPNPENKPCINHINGVKDDSRVENLEWCTYSENEKHSYNVLGKKPYLHTKENRTATSKRLKGVKLTLSHIEKLRKPKSNTDNYPKTKVILNKRHIFNSVTEASIKTGCKQSSISNNLIGISKKTKVGIWEYF